MNGTRKQFRKVKPFHGDQRMKKSKRKSIIISKKQRKIQEQVFEKGINKGIEEYF